MYQRRLASVEHRNTIEPTSQEGDQGALQLSPEVHSPGVINRVHASTPAGTSTTMNKFLTHRRLRIAKDVERAGLQPRLHELHRYDRIMPKPELQKRRIGGRSLSTIKQPIPNVHDR